MLYLVLCALFLAATSEPNPPTWPSNVHIFSPSDSANTQKIVDSIYAENGGHSPAFHGQWSNSRYALMFLPGSHSVTVNVGFYTSIIGLGAKPTDTTIGTLKCENGDFDYTGGALCNFWRSAENFQTNTNALWAVSQAAPMRRVVVNGNLDLYQYNSGCCAGYASGGFLADSTVTGTITSGSQQQWMTRNTHAGTWNGGVWNMVFVGVTGGLPTQHCGTPNPHTIVGSAPVIVEKPYIVYSGGKYALHIPRVETNKAGPTTNFDNADVVDFINVYVATQKDSAATINAKIAAGLHIVLTPGNYILQEPINVNKPGIVILGIGFPVLEAAAGTSCIVVGNVAGVRIAGILLQAGPKDSPSLLQFGSAGYQGDASNPGLIADVFARVGGPTAATVQQASAETMLQLNSGNTIVDHTWLWRADHDVGGLVMSSMDPVKHSAVIAGNDVTAYGIFAEHALQDLLVWNGNNGRCYFFQSELPYDVTQANYGTPGYAAYRVGTGVTNHHAWGVGAYSYFRDNAVTVANAIVAPSVSGIEFVNSLSVFLNGLGGITHVINGQGAAVSSTNRISYVCSAN
jgi:hypothetical protein